MTREEAKELLDNLIGMVSDNQESDYDTALKMGIKALEQEPCEDAISRKELLKAIYTWDKFGCDADNKLVQYRDHYIPYIHYDDVVKCIKGMPSVNPQKTGHWIRVDDTKMKCSNCDIIHLIAQYPRIGINYCPNCGCRMVEPQESEVKE